ncbi:aminopeptidase P family protein [Fusibacter sp. JL216-2]|uniref:aminopeptidase P family protein n=1 Tax=Fusibacter sp. JL216-2 TaxID=3071453 RepID=UPI003D34F9AE
MNTEFFKGNREAFVEKLQDDSVAVFFSGQAPYYSGDGQYPYTPNKNFYYLTGLERENFVLQFVKKKGKTKTTLFIERPNPDIEKWIGIKMRKNEAKDISGIETIAFADEFENQFNRLLMDGDFERLYLDIERQGFKTPKTYPMIFADQVRDKYAFVQIKTVQKIMAELRVVKKAEEVQALKKANGHTKAGFEAILKAIEPGLKEYEMSALFEYKVRCSGSKGLGFPTIAASGGNAVVLHYVENDATMQSGDLLLLDFGALHDNYSADISRTIPVDGKYTDRQKVLYNIVLKAQEAVIEAIKPGLPYAKLNEICKEVLLTQCKAIGLFEKDEDLAKYYYHGVGHYLGLDTHDIGNRETTLEPGMVVTVEPGLYIAEENIGIRIEDDILVTEDGFENLSLGIPKTVEEIETFMSN